MRTRTRIALAAAIVVLAGSAPAAAADASSSLVATVYPLMITKADAATVGVTVRHFGRYVQVVEVESEGTGAPPLTARQITTVDRLSDASGDRLLAALT